MIVHSTPVSIRAVQDQKAPRSQLIERSRHLSSQQARQNVPSVERGNRHHIEQRQEYVQLNGKCKCLNETPGDRCGIDVDVANWRDTKDDRDARRKQKVAGGAGGGDHHELLAPITPEPGGIHRHGLRPSDERQIRGHRDQWKQNRADRIDVHSRIERKSPECSGRRVAQPVGRPGVCGFVHREGDEQDYESEKELGEIQITNPLLCLRRQRLAFFDDEAGNGSNRGASLVDALMHLTGLDVERFAGFICCRCPAVVVERQNAVYHMHDGRSRMGMATFSSPNWNRDGDEHVLVAGNRDILLK